MSSRQEAAEGKAEWKSAFESFKLGRGEAVTGHKGGEESVCCMSIQIRSHSRASIQVKASFWARPSLQQHRETDYREGEKKEYQKAAFARYHVINLQFFNYSPWDQSAACSGHILPCPSTQQLSAAAVPEGTLSTQDPSRVVGSYLGPLSPVFPADDLGDGPETWGARQMNRWAGRGVN